MNCHIYQFIFSFHLLVKELMIKLLCITVHFDNNHSHIYLVTADIQILFHNNREEKNMIFHVILLKKDQITCIENDYDSSFKFKGQTIKRINIADKNT